MICERRDLMGNEGGWVEEEVVFGKNEVGMMGVDVVVDGSEVG